MKFVLVAILLISFPTISKLPQYKICGSLNVPVISYDEASLVAKQSMNWIVEELEKLYPDEYPQGWNKKFEYKVSTLTEGNKIKQLMKICFLQESEHSEVKLGNDVSVVSTKKLHQQVSILLAEKYNAKLDLAFEDLDQLGKKRLDSESNKSTNTGF